MQLNKYTSTKHLFWGMLSCIGLIAWLSCSYRNSSKYQQQSYGTTICTSAADQNTSVSTNATHPDREHHLSSRIKYKVKLTLKKMAADAEQYSASSSNNSHLNSIISTYTYLERPAYYTFLFRYFLF